uniref:Uncharacterized protein n=1 Tax=viral metagenome TaxID=1070528 RepID=A0A6C0KVZ8_9ZZZZ
MLSIASPAIQAHMNRFELIDNHAGWFNLYEEFYVGDGLTPAHDKIDKDTAILRATFQALANAEQLRVRRAIALTDDEYGELFYHEIQILDQNKQVVHTIRGTIDREYARWAPAEEYFMRSALAPSFWDPNQVTVDMVLPLTFPNRPEFLDADGLPLVCPFLRYMDSFYAIPIEIGRNFVTNDFETEEMRPVHSRKRCMERCNVIKEDLMIKCWSPVRVEKLLLAGYDVEDM